MARHITCDQIKEILPAEKIKNFERYLEEQNKILEQQSQVKPQKGSENKEDKGSGKDSDKVPELTFAQQHLSDLIAGQVRNLDFIRVNVRPDAFVVNLYANEGEYFCKHSQYPPVPFARFVSTAETIARDALEAFGTAFFEQVNDINTSILHVSKVSWVKENLSTGESRVKAISVPIKDLERK